MDPTLPQDPAELLQKAREQKREAAVESALIFTGLVAGGVAVAKKSHSVGEFLVEFGGFKLTPKSSFSFAKPGLFAVTFAAPGPIGVVPPEEYGISPDYLGPLLPDILLRETLGTKGTDIRRAAFELQEFQDYLTNYEQVGRSKRRISNAELQLLLDQYAQLNPDERVGEHLTANLALFGIQRFAEQNGITLQPPQLIHKGHLQPVEVDKSGNTIRALVGQSGADAAQRLQQSNPPDP